jgi:hypothetical protein
MLGSGSVQSRDEGWASMAAAQGAVGMGAQRLVTVFLISGNYSLCGIYFCDISNHSPNPFLGQLFF